MYIAVYASLYSYAKDINFIRTFCESWCPTTNTLHTQLGELSISLWDLYKLGRLPISREIYDETVPPHDYYLSRDKNGDRVIPKACGFLFAAYQYLAKLLELKKGVSAQQWVENSNSTPKHTHNPYGVLKDRPTSWTQGEATLFDSLGIFGENRRLTTYVRAFSLVVLSSIYRGLNIISRSSKLDYSRACFPTHYVYGWLAHYFITNYVVDSPPRGPLMVIFLGAKAAKCFNGQEARTLKCAHFDYLISLRSGFFPLGFGDSFHIEPYTPYRFGRQFGFCQDVLSMLSRCASDQTVTYYEALRYQKLWLFKGSESRVHAPCVALNWHNLTTPRFQSWWSKVSISDLRDNMTVLCSSIEPDLSRTKKKPPSDAKGCSSTTLHWFKSKAYRKDLKSSHPFGKG
ncbi:Cystic fibrosis transmembrane conductance regulator [Bienertia sinuspersici]